MTAFQTALDFVCSTLREYRDQGVKISASSAALSQLAATLDAAEAAPAFAPMIPPPERPGVAEITPAPIEESFHAPRAADPVPAVADRMTVPLAREEPPPLAAGNPGSKAARLAGMRGPVLQCVKCPHLVKSRTQVVFGIGNPEAELMFVGEAPGEDEDRKGEPFVGPAGLTLTRIITAMGFPREEIYIANVLKCRPNMPSGESGNRPPTREEMQTCLPYLREQIEIIQPRVLVALGATAMLGLLGAAEPMAKLRNRWHAFQGIPLMPTYHPAYLLRNQSLTEKRKVWDDMLLVLEKMGRAITPRQRGFFLSKD